MCRRFKHIDKMLLHHQEAQLRVEDDFYTHLTTPAGHHVEGRLNLLLLLSARDNDDVAVSRLLQVRKE